MCPRLMVSGQMSGIKGSLQALPRPCSARLARIIAVSRFARLFQLMKISLESLFTGHGIFAERQRPEPIHCEMNAQEQLLHLIYIEYVQRGKFDDFVNILGAPVVKCTSPDTAAEQEVIWSTDDLLPFKQSTGNQGAMAGDDPHRNTETRLCEQRRPDWTWYAKWRGNQWCIYSESRLKVRGYSSLST